MPPFGGMGKPHDGFVPPRHGDGATFRERGGSLDADRGGWMRGRNEVEGNKATDEDVADGQVVVVSASILVRKAWGWMTALDEAKAYLCAELGPEAMKRGHVDLPSVFQDPKKELTVVVPAYNEAERIGSMLRETLEYLEKRTSLQPGFEWEVLVVDDGSRDRTGHVVSQFAKKHGNERVRCLRLPRNCGKGYAVRRGMLGGRGKKLLMADADGATRIEECDRLERALEKLTQGNEDQPAVSVGSRAHLETASTARRSFYRTVLMHGFHACVWMVIGGEIKDTQCGFKLFNRKAAQKIYANQRLRRWCFDVELIFLAKKLGIPVCEVAVNWTEIPGSKIRFWSMASMLVELITIKIAYEWLCVWKIDSL
eukprot:scaffold86_cov338-Pavlova_lutheri.AAC.82